MRGGRFNNFILGCALLLVDYVTIIVAEYGAFLLRSCLLPTGIPYISWLNYWVIFPLIYLLFLNMGQLYSRQMLFYKEVKYIFRACCYSAMTMVLVLYVANIAASTSRIFVGLFAVFTFVLLTFTRYFMKKFLLHHGLLQIPVLVIGAGKTAELLVKAINNNAGMSYQVVGLLEDHHVQPGILEQYPVLGRFDQAEEIIRQTKVRDVFVAAPGMEEKKLAELISRIQLLVNNVAVIPNLVGVPAGRVEVESIFYEKFIILRLKNNLARRRNRMFKGIFDFVLTLVGTICISPILLVIAIGIRRDSPGPIIYDGLRLGKDGKPFKCYKFRTMQVNGETILQKYLADHPEEQENWKIYHKLEHDPRVTKLGDFLRRTSLDELPQIFNVLKGEMSLVGPRPYLPSEEEEMGSLAKTVLVAKPGITGYWQTSGRSNIDFQERVEMECWYVCNWNLWLDIVLLFKTFAAVVLRRGAY